MVVSPIIYEGFYHHPNGGYFGFLPSTVFNTLPETNIAAIAPENRPSQKETNLPIIHFQGGYTPEI